MQVLEGNPADWLGIESQLESEGFQWCFHHRPSSLVSLGVSKALLVLQESPNNHKWAVSASVESSRAAPGFQIVRVERFAPVAPDEQVLSGLKALVDFARRSKRIFRIDLDIYTPEASLRSFIRSKAEALGFQSVVSRRLYSRTLIVDLRMSEEELLRSFKRLVRRNIKKTHEAGHLVRRIREERFADRLEELVLETMQRGGGPKISNDWGRILAYSRDWPNRSRISGLFLDGEDDAAALASFRWCVIHGSFAEDLVAASSRPRVSVPLMHSVMWDMLKWMKNNRVDWFDFGGIPEGDKAKQGPLAGIYSFKKLFSETAVTIRREMTLEVKPFIAQFASRVSGLRKALGNVARS